jgi:hypothetical protein
MRVFTIKFFDILFWLLPVSWRERERERERETGGVLGVSEIARKRWVRTIAAYI